MDLRQLVRWAIPGWLFILFLAIFLLIHCTLGGGLTWTAVATPLEKNGLSPFELLLALLAVGVPLGYLLDQLYYFHYWNRWDFIPVGVFIRRIQLWKWSCPVLWLRLTSFVPHDRGYEILKDSDIDFERLVDVKLDPISENRKILPKRGFPIFGFGYIPDKPSDLIETYKKNWYLAEFAWYHTLSARGLEFLDEEAQFLVNVYHSLGATRTAFSYAFLVAFGALPVIENGLKPDLLVKCLSYISRHPFNALGILGLYLVPYLLFSHAREDALGTLIALKHHVITPLAKLPRTCTHRTVDGIHMMKNSA